VSSAIWRTVASGSVASVDRALDAGRSTALLDADVEGADVRHAAMPASDEVSATPNANDTVRARPTGRRCGRSDRASMTARRAGRMPVSTRGRPLDGLRQRAERVNRTRVLSTQMYPLAPNRRVGGAPR
jgi:hypothetical protein